MPVIALALLLVTEYWLMVGPHGKPDALFEIVALSEILGALAAWVR